MRGERARDLARDARGGAAASTARSNSQRCRRQAKTGKCSVKRSRDKPAGWASRRGRAATDSMKSVPCAVAADGPRSDRPRGAGAGKRSRGQQHMADAVGKSRSRHGRGVLAWRRRCSSDPQSQRRRGAMRNKGWSPSSACIAATCGCGTALSICSATAQPASSQKRATCAARSSAVWHSMMTPRRGDASVMPSPLSTSAPGFPTGASLCIRSNARTTGFARRARSGHRRDIRGCPRNARRAAIPRPPCP